MRFPLLGTGSSCVTALRKAVSIPAWSYRPITTSDIVAECRGSDHPATNVVDVNSISRRHGLVPSMKNRRRYGGTHHAAGGNPTSLPPGCLYTPLPINRAALRRIGDASRYHGEPMSEHRIRMPSTRPQMLATTGPMGMIHRPPSAVAEQRPWWCCRDKLWMPKRAREDAEQTRTIFWRGTYPGGNAAGPFSFVSTAVHTGSAGSSAVHSLLPRVCVLLNVCVRLRIPVLLGVRVMKPWPVCQTAHNKEPFCP